MRQYVKALTDRALVRVLPSTKADAVCWENYEYCRWHQRYAYICCCGYERPGLCGATQSCYTTDIGGC
jgi:hypothetical protein